MSLMICVKFYDNYCFSWTWLVYKLCLYFILVVNICLYVDFYWELYFVVDKEHTIDSIDATWKG